MGNEKKNGHPDDNEGTNNGGDQLSPEVRGVLEVEAQETEIQAAIDAAAEEGMRLSREEAMKILEEQRNNSSNP